MIAKSKTIKHDVISEIFIPAAIAMILTQLVGIIATLIDGVITSNYYGANAYSAVSLTSPIINTIVLVAAFISTGCQIVCSGQIGRGEKKSANATFSIAIIVSIAIIAFFMIIGFSVPDFLFSICGVTPDEHPEIFPYMQEYIKGYLWGVPAIVFVQILSPILVMDNDKKLVTISAFVLCIADVIGDCIAAQVFNAGNFGMGLASAIAYYIELLMLLCHFMRKNCYFKFTLKDWKLSQLLAMFKSGSPTFVRKLATILRDLFINRFNLVLALSTAAVAARGIQNDLNVFMFSLGLGIGRVMITMTSLYYSANDKEALKRLFVVAHKVAFYMSGIVGAIMFIFARQVVFIFSRDPEILDLAVFSVRCMAIGLIFDTLAVTFQNYLQGIQNLKLVNFMNFGERFFIPVITALALGYLFGSKGILASVAIGKIILAIMMFIMVCVNCKGLPKKLTDFMFVKPDFGGETEDNYYCILNTMDDVMTASNSIEDFCEKHGIDETRKKHLALYIEEFGGNVVNHGITKNRHEICINMRVHISDNDISLTMRDYCETFDCTKYYEIHKNENSTEHLGIRMVMKTAKDVCYVNAFNSNNIIIRL